MPLYISHHLNLVSTLCNYTMSLARCNRPYYINDLQKRSKWQQITGKINMPDASFPGIISSRATISIPFVAFNYFGFLLTSKRVDHPHFMMSHPSIHEGLTFHTLITESHMKYDYMATVHKEDRMCYNHTALETEATHHQAAALPSACGVDSAEEAWCRCCLSKSSLPCPSFAEIAKTQ